MRGTITSRQRRAIFAVSAIAALTALALPAGAAAATRYVDDSGDADPLLNCTNPIDPCLSIDQGIGKASAGDTIAVGGGTYGPFTLSKAVDVAESNFNPGVTAGDAIVSGGAARHPDRQGPEEEVQEAQGDVRVLLDGARIDVPVQRRRRPVLAVLVTVHDQGQEGQARVRGAGDRRRRQR